MSYPGSGTKDEPWGAYYITRMRTGRATVSARRICSEVDFGRAFIGPLSSAIATAHCLCGTNWDRDDWARACERVSRWNPAFEPTVMP